MALPRPSCLRGVAGRSTLRKTGQQARSKSFRDVGRRFYASGHEAKKSSDLPWAIGSIAVTVPAATWLLGQAPAKSGHGHHDDHGHDEEEEGGPKEEEAETKEEEAQPQEGEGKNEGEDKPAEEESKDSEKDQAKSDDSGSDDEGKDTPPTSDDEQGYEPPGPNAWGQINRNPRKRPGETQKGERKPTEKKGEKDAASDHSGAHNPRFSETDRPRSYKQEGVMETAKIHGTVDPRRNSSKPRDPE